MSHTAVEEEVAKRLGRIDDVVGGREHGLVVGSVARRSSGRPRPTTTEVGVTPAS
jgi:hypothetical protein